MSDQATNNAATFAALRRCQTPGLLLMFVGLLNVMGGLYLVAVGAQTMHMTLGQFEDELIRSTPKEHLQRLHDAGLSVDRMKRIMGPFSAAWGITALCAAILTFYGGYNLRHLQYWRLALIGSVLAMIPGISPLGCFGAGELVGLWAILVVTRADVRMQFA